jgi:hypothetical protein
LEIGHGVRSFCPSAAVLVRDPKMVALMLTGSMSDEQRRGTI